MQTNNRLNFREREQQSRQYTGVIHYCLANKRRFMQVMLLMIGGLFFTAVLALHVSDLPYELEVSPGDTHIADAVDSTSGDFIDDAQTIYCDHIDPDRMGVCVGVDASVALTSTFIVDKVGEADDDIFTIGSKDIDPIAATEPSSWRWALSGPGAPPNKDDIGNVWAGVYEKEGHIYIAFGLDRLANNGDAELGFWFLQDDVGPIDNGGSLEFSGAHTENDILVLSDFTNGGSTSTFEIYRWDPAADGGAGDPVILQTSSGCGLGENTFGCAITNFANSPDPIAPWPYAFKGMGPINRDNGSFPENTYFEAAIDLTELFPDGIPCIRSFIADTRSSQELTADLKDFAGGVFDLCGFEVTKTANDYSKVGDQIAYTVTVTNTGALPIFKNTVTDSLAGVLTGGVCEDKDGAPLAETDPLQNGGSCVFEYTYTPMAGAGTLDNTVTAIYNIGGTEGQAVSETATETVNLIAPSISLSKTASPTNGVKQGDQVDYSLTLMNTSADVLGSGLVCTLTDDKGTVGTGDDINITGISLSAAAQRVENYSLTLVDTGAHTNTATATCVPDLTGFTNEVMAQDQVTINVRKANVNLTVTKDGDPHSKVGDAVNYDFTITNLLTSEAAITVDSISDTVLGDLLATAKAQCEDPINLAIGEDCTFSANRTTQGGDPDPLPNTVTVNGTDAFANAVGPVQANDSVNLLQPDFTVAKTCTPDSVVAGDNLFFNIDINNTGNPELALLITDDLLAGSPWSVTIAEQGACVYQANLGIVVDAQDGCLRIEGNILTTTAGTITNNVTVDAEIPLSYGSFNNVITQGTASSSCTVRQGGDATRTQGFWKTHGSDNSGFPSPVEYGFTCHIARDHVGFPIDLGWKTATACEDVFGLFMASPAKQSDGSRRGNLCKTQLLGTRQLLAAILNTALINGEDTHPDGTPISDYISEMQAALAAGDRKEINRLKGLLDEYNNAGDEVSIVTDVAVPHADPNGTRIAADYVIADCP